MGRQVTLKFGFAGDVRDVTVVLPDDEPIPWQWGEQFSVLRRETPRVDGPLKATGSARYSYDVQMPGCSTERSCGARTRTRWCAASICPGPASKAA
jgi:hypothetical protein